MFKLDNALAPTGLLPKEGDTILQGRRMCASRVQPTNAARTDPSQPDADLCCFFPRLYPSPVSGRGSRLFTLCHVLVHVTSVILSIAFVAQATDAMADNGIEADGASAILVRARHRARALVAPSRL